MYITSKCNFLSKSICIVAILNVLMQVINVLIRVFFKPITGEFDMQNDIVFFSQLILQIILIIVVFLVFFFAMRGLDKLQGKISDSDKTEIAYLQEKYLKSTLPSLPADSVYQLLQIWASIFVLIQSMSIITNYQYRSFVDEISEILPKDDLEISLQIASLYNSTHGFKYICMYTALILGIFITGIFLKDRMLKTISVVLASIFMVAFAILEMGVILTSARVISIVWTSVIYHGVETIGLLVLAIYLSKHYKGL